MGVGGGAGPERKGFSSAGYDSSFVFHEKLKQNI